MKIPEQARKCVAFVGIKMSNGDYRIVGTAYFVINDLTKNKIEYEYPGRRLSGYFFETDTSRAYNLGHDNLGNINFIKLKAGKGNIYVHQAPLAFSNYFLLHKNNMSYYETALSYLPKNKKQVVWDFQIHPGNQTIHL